MIEIIYEDNHIIVALKPQNLPSQADESGDEDMLSLVKKYIKEKYNKPGNVYVGLVHRLDRPTGGLMVFAKTSKAAARLSAAIGTDEFEKTYLAVVLNKPKQEKAYLTHYLLKDEDENKVAVVPFSTTGAKKAELSYKTLETVDGLSLLKLQLYTGRSHQIRVQMHAIGCSVFGDVKYGGEKMGKGHKLALWAFNLTFQHPVSKKVMNFTVYPPLENEPWKRFKL